MRQSITASQPHSAPAARPPSTSVGKWTYRYSLEKAMSAAKIRAGHLPFQRHKKSTVTAAKDRLREWLHPDEATATDEVDDVTAECEDCGQTVAKDPDWEGICKACSPGVEDDDR